MTTSHAIFRRAPLLLEARGLRKSFDGTDVLSGASLNLGPGEVAVLLGPNGSGKTTLLALLGGFLTPDAGSVLVCGRQIQERSVPARTAAMVQAGIVRTWQDARMFATRSLRDNIAVATPRQIGERPLAAVIRRRAVREQESAVRRECDRMLERVGLGDRGSSSGDRVSLGQARRVEILRAIRSGARVLLMDEPLAGLDDPGIDDVLALVTELRASHDVAMLIVEHALNAPRLVGLRPRVLRLVDGKVRDNGDCLDDLGNTPAEAVLAAAGANRTSLRVDLGRDATLRIARLPDSSEVALRARDLHVRRGRRVVFGNSDSIDLELRRGDLAVLEAPNGWGKTSLLDAIAGLLPASGALFLGGEDAAPLSTDRRVRAGLRYVRASTGLFPGLTVREAFRLAGRDPQPVEWRSFRDRSIRTLSGGERRRLALATVPTGPCRIALYDEPFAALDHETIRRILPAIVRGGETTLIALPAASRRIP